MYNGNHTQPFKGPSSAPQNTISHSLGWSQNNSRPASLKLKWSIRRNFTADVVFRATFVQSYSTYWVGVQSGKLKHLPSISTASCCQNEQLINTNGSALCNILHQVQINRVYNSSTVMHVLGFSDSLDEFTAVTVLRCYMWSSMSTTKFRSSVSECCSTHNVSARCQKYCTAGTYASYTESHSEVNPTFLIDCISDFPIMATCLLYPDTTECLNGNPCSINANCSEFAGSAICTCKSGFTGNGISCQDINECATFPCSVRATCANTPGSYTCTCRVGYLGDGFICHDIDECSASPPPCSLNASCSNIVGSFNCFCRAGFTGDGFNCQDIDECSASPHPCSLNASCSNTVGTFNCICIAGFTGDGFICQGIAVPVPVLPKNAVTFTIVTTILTNVTSQMGKTEIFNNLEKELLIAALAPIQGYNSVRKISDQIGSLIVTSEAVFNATTVATELQFPSLSAVQAGINQRAQTINYMLPGQLSFNQNIPVTRRSIPGNTLCIPLPCPQVAGYIVHCVEIGITSFQCQCVAGTLEVSCTTITSPTSAVATTSQPSTADPPSPTAEGFPPAAIGGIVGGVVVIIIIVVVVICCRRKRTEPKKPDVVYNSPHYVEPNQTMMEPIYSEIKDVAGNNSEIPEDKRVESSPSPSGTYLDLNQGVNEVDLNQPKPVEVLQSANGGYEAPMNINAGYEAPMSENAGYEAPMNVNAGYEAPMSENAGYEAPMNVNAGYEAPVSENAGYEAPINVNAGYEAPISVNAGYEAPVSDNAGYEDPIKSMSDKTFVSSSPALPQRNNIVVVEGPDGYLKPPTLVPMTQGEKLVEETESQRNLGEYELYDKSTKSEVDATQEVQGENKLNQHDSSVSSSDGTSFSTAGNKTIPSVENVTLAV